MVAPKKIGSASSGNYDVLNKIVYLDAGHGGYDPGASYFGISEKSLTLAIQSRVKAKLEDRRLSSCKPLAQVIPMLT